MNSNTHCTEEDKTADFMFLVSSSASIVTSADCDSQDMGDLAQPRRDPAQPSTSGYIPVTTYPEYQKSISTGKNSAETPANGYCLKSASIYSPSCTNGYGPIASSDCAPASTIGYRLATSTCAYTPCSSREYLPVTAESGCTLSAETSENTSTLNENINSVGGAGNSLPTPESMEVSAENQRGSPILVQYDAYHQTNIFLHHPLSKSAFTKEHFDKTTLLYGAVLPDKKLNYQDFSPSLTGLDQGTPECRDTFRYATYLTLPSGENQTATLAQCYSV